MRSQYCVRAFVSRSCVRVHAATSATSVIRCRGNSGVSYAYGRSRFCQVVCHEMFHSFPKAEVPYAARIALVCMRDACGGGDMVCTQSIAAATESYRRCLTRCKCRRANPCTMPPKWRRGKLCTVAKLYLKRARGFAQKTSASHQEQLAHINSDLSLIHI